MLDETPEKTDKTASTRLTKSAASGPSAAAPAPAPPCVPDHELLSCIGSGSYGEVWLARNVMGTYRAVKMVYRKNFAHDRPFEREFDGIKQFEPVSRRHESQIDILHVGRNADGFYYVMELADDAGVGRAAIQSETQGTSPGGGAAHSPGLNPATYVPRTLQYEIRQRGPLPLEECLLVALSLATALEHLHQHGLIHRDIKPSNIIFVQGVPKLADIGLVTTEGATQSYVGTEGFIPPEGPGTPPADVYSLGKVLYELSTGKDRQDFPETPTQWEANADEPALLEFNAVVLKACEPILRNRYSSAREMRADLERLQRGQSVVRRHSVRRRSILAARLAVAAMLVALMVVGGWHLLNARKPQNVATPTTPSAERTTEIRSIAVLPFLNESQNKDDEIWSDGIPDSILSALTRVNGLKVAARNSSFSFKGRNSERREIGEKLRVGALLEGSVHKRADQFHITAELIDAQGGYQLWSDTYDGDQTKLLSLPGEIAQRVAAALNIPLGAEATRRIARRPTENIEAHSAFEKGRYFWHNRGLQGMVEKAVDAFNEAIHLDPNYAEAYAGLADCYGTRASWESGELRPREAFPKARDFAKLAIQMDDSLAEPHATLGYFYTHFDWDWASAEEEFKKALARNPNYDNAHHWYSHLLMAMGRVKESLEESKAYLQCSPTDPLAHIHLAWHYHYAHQYTNALEEISKAFDLKPDYHWAYYFRGWVYQQQPGHLSEAVMQFENAVTFSGTNKVQLAALGNAYAVAGQPEKARQVLAQLVGRSEQGEYLAPFEIALIYVGLGDKDEAFRWLDKAIEDRSGWIPYLKLEPRLNSIRNENDFKKLVNRVSGTSQ